MHGFFYRNRGTAYFSQGAFDLAIADYTKAIEMDPQDADAYGGRGMAYRQKGLRSEAIADLEAYLRLTTSVTARAGVEQLIAELKGQ